MWASGPNPIDPDASWPPPVIEKITTSFTTRGGQVVLLTVPEGSGGPENSHNEPPVAAADSTVETALTAIRELDRTAEAVTLPHTARCESVSRPYWADLIDQPPHLGDKEVAPATGPQASAARELSADADLVIASLQPEHGDKAISDHLARTAGRLLRTGGIVAVLTHTDTTGGRLVDPTGPVVAACQNADLLYLQHIVVLLAPIRDGGFVLTPDLAETDARNTPNLVADQRSEPHRRIHADLLVFAQPHAYTALGFADKAEAPR